MTARYWQAAGKPFVLVNIAATGGSTPRDAGAMMLVSRDTIAGSIGGGRLEYLAMEKARSLLDDPAGTGTTRETIKLGPEIGQCCGGSADLEFVRDEVEAVSRLETAGDGEAPLVVIFGAGHTGMALARALAPLPLRVKLADSRPGFLEDTPAGIEAIATALPESLVSGAPAGSAFVVMTHDHYLDFAITAEALDRGDAAYAGMIGSGTKRAVFRRWMAENGYDPELCANLTCPIGSWPADTRNDRTVDKRPEVIAALVAGELAACLLGGMNRQG